METKDQRGSKKGKQSEKDKGRQKDRETARKGDRVKVEMETERQKKGRKRTV